MNRFLNGLRKRPGIPLILTSRGLLFLVAALYLTLAAGFRHADIIACVIGIFVLMFLLVIVALALTQGTHLARGLSLSFPAKSGDEAEAGCVAGFQYICSLRLGPRRIFPFFQLRIIPVFEHSKISLPALIISGSNRSDGRIMFPLTFPHRGIWRINRLRCSLQDQFGFARFTWQLPCQYAIRVEPPSVEQSRVPVMSSSHRSGDVAIEVTHREGEPFDIKRYHPSDGIKKILWKVYAKSGELLSRHPEASFTPEGQVALFAVARPEDDMACAEVIAYMRRAEEQELEVFLGASSFVTDQIARTAEEAHELLIETVWASSRPADILGRFKAELVETLGDTRLDRILVFLSNAFFEKPECLSEIESIHRVLSEGGIKPVFILCGCESMSPRPLPAITSRIRRLFVAEPPSMPVQMAPYKDEFLASSTRNNWEVITA